MLKGWRHSVSHLGEVPQERGGEVPNEGVRGGARWLTSAQSRRNWACNRESFSPRRRSDARSLTFLRRTTHSSSLREGATKSAGSEGVSHVSMLCTIKLAGVRAYTA